MQMIVQSGRTSRRTSRQTTRRRHTPNQYKTEGMNQLESEDQDEDITRQEQENTKGGDRAGPDRGALQVQGRDLMLWRRRSRNENTQHDELLVKDQ